MKYSELEAKLFEIKSQIAQLDEERQYVKDQYSLTKVSLGPDSWFTARWKADPDTGLHFRIEYFVEGSIVAECLDGSLYTRRTITTELDSICHKVGDLLGAWLSDQIDWPFNEEEYPRR